MVASSIEGHAAAAAVPQELFAPGVVATPLRDHDALARDHTALARDYWKSWTAVT
jgi:hypothetical protein